MTNTALGYVLSYLYLFTVIFGIGVLQKVLHFTTETSRKLIHILIGFTWMILYFCFWDNWQIVIVPITFIIINAASYKFKLFKMIEREDSSNNHKGTIYFSIGITALMICALLWPSTIMATGIATFALCFGDGFAGLVGYKAKRKIHLTKNKTLQGTGACILATAASIILFSKLMSLYVPFGATILLSVLCGLLELMEWGFDNFTILGGVYIVASYLIAHGVIY